MHAHSYDKDSDSVAHGHTHGAVDAQILASERGIWATKISLGVLLATAAAQLVIVAFTGSVACWPTRSTILETPPLPCPFGRFLLCPEDGPPNGSPTATDGRKTWLVC